MCGGVARLLAHLVPIHAHLSDRSTTRTSALHPSSARLFLLYYVVTLPLCYTNDVFRVFSQCWCTLLTCVLPVSQSHLCQCRRLALPLPDSPHLDFTTYIPSPSPLLQYWLCVKCNENTVGLTQLKWKSPLNNKLRVCTSLYCTLQNHHSQQKSIKTSSYVALNLIINPSFNLPVICGKSFQHLNIKQLLFAPENISDSVEAQKTSY